MKAAKESVLVNRECRRCGYVACCCHVLKAHKPECTRRKAILNTSPTACEQHDRRACEDCWPCDCAHEEAAE